MELEFLVLLINDYYNGTIYPQNFSWNVYTGENPNF